MEGVRGDKWSSGGGDIVGDLADILGGESHDGGRARGDAEVGTVVDQTVSGTTVHWWSLDARVTLMKNWLAAS